MHDAFVLNPPTHRLRHFVRKLLPHPLPQSFTLELFFIIQLVVLQDLILPQALGQLWFVDLLTPWIIVLCVFGTWKRVVPITLFSIALLEAHASAPVGIFFCFYWIVCVLVFSFRHHISWQNLAPWMATFFVSQTLLVVLEILANLTQGEATSTAPFLNRELWVSLVLRIVTTTLVGTFVVWRFGLLHREEIPRVR